MNKMIVFDMDGTIADLYGVKDWLPKLRASDPSPYAEAKPLCNMDLLASVLMCLQLNGVRIAVTSWLSKGSTKDYDKQVRQAKREWLKRYGFPVDEIHLVKYGTRKAICTRKFNGEQILIDDNDEIRSTWNKGRTINPTKEDIINSLIEILADCFN